MPDEKTGGADRVARSLCVFEKHQQLIHRHAPSFIRHVLERFRQHSLNAALAAAELGLSRSRLYALATAYNSARARKQPPLWTPGASGGDHTTAWPPPVVELLKKRLACSPPCPYSFAASEALRLHSFKLDRAQVRRWAIQNNLAHAVPPKRILAPVRRWQRAQIGELWQLDASPHRWFPPSKLSFPMLNMLDDCSRLFTGSKLYERELLLSYFDFLPAAFLAHGRPFQLYVDYHSLFFTHDPDALTQLGWALKFYDISFQYAPTPQAKEMVSYCASYELFSVLCFPPVPVLSHFDFGDNFVGRSLVKVVISVAEPTACQQAGFSPIVNEARFALQRRGDLAHG